MPENITTTNGATHATTDPTPVRATAMVNAITLSGPEEAGTADVHVSVQTTASTDALWDCWTGMFELIEAANQTTIDLHELWTQTTDPVAQQRLWADYESAVRNFRMLTSWKDVLYAAYVFATDGALCAGTQFTVPPAPPSGPQEF